MGREVKTLEAVPLLSRKPRLERPAPDPGRHEVNSAGGMLRRKGRVHPEKGNCASQEKNWRGCKFRVSLEKDYGPIGGKLVKKKTSSTSKAVIWSGSSFREKKTFENKPRSKKKMRLGKLKHGIQHIEREGGKTTCYTSRKRRDLDMG